MREIEDVLHFRGDISPFLVHLTRETPRTTARWLPVPLRTAKSNLQSILHEGRLRQGGSKMSVAAFGVATNEFNQRIAADPEFVTRYLSGISFTETPLGEIHSLLEITRRQVELKPYGLVFLKSRLMRNGVEPAIYLNNFQGDKAALVQALFQLIDTQPQIAEQVLPLLTVFGRRITAPGSAAQTAELDFLWEREWRYRGARGDLVFSLDEDVFMGLCPDDEILEFEAQFPGLPFIDPRRNMKWYATKLIEARQAFDLKDSVV